VGYDQNNILCFQWFNSLQPHLHLKSSFVHIICKFLHAYNNIKHVQEMLARNKVHFCVPFHFYFSVFGDTDPLLD